MDWRHRAQCRGTSEPDAFFPAGINARQQTAEAKAVCHRCPVAEECLAWAIATAQDAGVWGGLDEDERRVLARHLARVR